MQSKEFLELCEKMKRELKARYYDEPCRELHLDCLACRAHVVIGAINGLMEGEDGIDEFSNELAALWEKKHPVKASIRRQWMRLRYGVGFPWRQGQ